MTYYSQRDPRWANQTFYGNLTFKSYGCFVCSLAMLCDKEPPIIAQILRDNGCFDNQGMLLSDKAAQVLGLEYNGKSTQRPEYPCIAETLYYDKVATPAPEQHFFVIKPDGAILDPLNTNINYPIKSYRLFKAKGESMSCETDLTAMTKLMEAYKNKADDRAKTITELNTKITELQAQLPCPVCPPCPTVSDSLWDKIKAFFGR